jgi:hypothetical protein
MFALDLKKLELHEKKLDAVSRLETSIPDGQIVVMFFRSGEGWSAGALLETRPACEFGRDHQ